MNQFYFRKIYFLICIIIKMQKKLTLISRHPFHSFPTLDSKPKIDQIRSIERRTAHPSYQMKTEMFLPSGRQRVRPQIWFWMNHAHRPSFGKKKIINKLKIIFFCNESYQIEAGSVSIVANKALGTFFIPVPALTREAIFG